MRFKSPTEEPIHIALKSSHTCLIGPKFIEIEPMFHREAIARGAIPEGLKGEKIKAMKPDDRKALVVKAMTEMLEGVAEGDFTKDGKPDLDALAKRVGFTVGRDERDAIWKELEEKQEGDGDGPDA